MVSVYPSEIAIIMYRFSNWQGGEVIQNRLRKRKRNSNATSPEGQCQKPANPIDMAQRREDWLEREEKLKKRK